MLKVLLVWILWEGLSVYPLIVLSPLKPAAGVITVSGSRAVPRGQLGRASGDFPVPLTNTLYPQLKALSLFMHRHSLSLCLPVPSPSQAGFFPAEGVQFWTNWTSCQQKETKVFGNYWLRKLINKLLFAFKKFLFLTWNSGKISNVGVWRVGFLPGLVQEGGGRTGGRQA